MNPSTETSNELKNLRNEINRGTRVLNLSGLTSISAKAYILSEIQKETNKTFVVVTDLNNDLQTWESDLDFFQKSVRSPESEVQSPNAENSKLSTLNSRLLTLPSFEADVYSGVSPHAETQEERALTLWNLTKNKPNFLILSAKSLITKIPSPEKLKNLGANLKRDEDFPPDVLIGKLFACGYKKDEPIANIGEFSTRGGIIDVWSPDAENPVRIEFFGDTVDSIRTFDADSQLSIEQLDEISIAPMREFAATSDDFEIWAELAGERFNDEKFKRNLKDRTDFADEGESFSGWEFLMPLVNDVDASIFDYLEDCIFIIDEPTVVEQNLGDFYERLQDHFEEIIEHGEIGLEPFELFLEPEILREHFEKNQRLELRSLGKVANATDEEFQNL